METVTRSTLVVTMESETAADSILAKGLSFGGRRHEAEKFWMKGEGGIWVQCCGNDHFGKCNEAARCYVCTESGTLLSGEGLRREVSTMRASRRKVCELWR